jgi:hypothetical protein
MSSVTCNVIFTNFIVSRKIIIFVTIIKDSVTLIEQTTVPAYFNSEFSRQRNRQANTSVIGRPDLRGEASGSSVRVHACKTKHAAE